MWTILPVVSSSQIQIQILIQKYPSHRRAIGLIIALVSACSRYSAALAGVNGFRHDGCCRSRFCCLCVNKYIQLWFDGQYIISCWLKDFQTELWVLTFADGTSFPFVEGTSLWYNYSSHSYVNNENLWVQDICDVYDGKTTNLHEIVGDSFPAHSGICFRGAGEKGDYVEIKFIVTRS